MTSPPKVLILQPKKIYSVPYRIFSSQGIGVIFISSDLEEVIRVSDRIIVIRDGMAVCEMENRDLTVQDIMNKIFNV